MRLISRKEMMQTSGLISILDQISRVSLKDTQMFSIVVVTSSDHCWFFLIFKDSHAAFTWLWIPGLTEKFFMY